MADKSCNSHQCGDADAALNHIISYEFVFISHFMRELLGITDILYQALQKKTQDIVNAVRLVSTTKSLIQRLREDRWESFLEEVNLFCQSHNILTPDMNALYVARKGQARHQQDITVEHHYRVDIFYIAIDKQLQELNTRFNDTALGLLTLTGAMEPNNGYIAFDSNKICSLIGRYCPSDFTMQERVQLKYELQHFICEVKEDNHSKLRNLSTLQELCQYLAEKGKSEIYYLFDRLIRLILTLPVSTATTERAFSAMKIMKTRLRIRMEDDFLADSLVIYIEREISKSFSLESIVDDFKVVKDRRALFNM